MAEANTKLSEEEAAAMLAALDNWSIVGGKLHKEFKFADFSDAMSFIIEVAEVAESLNHHPEIFNVYSRVTLDLETHDVGGLSRLDFAFAKAVDQLPPSQKSKAGITG